MATRGNKPLEKKDIVVPAKLRCLSCNKGFESVEFYDSDSELYGAIGKLPYCKECLDKIYRSHLAKYLDLNCMNPEQKALERICMSMDLYYSEKLYETAYKESQLNTGSIVFYYLKKLKLYQYRKKNYNTTIEERIIKGEPIEDVSTVELASVSQEEIEKAMRLFGNGFSKDDYKFLLDQYGDWTTRHECETKSQEEVFKQICFTQLELSKARRAGSDTKDLNMTLLKQLEAAKLQPKQNKSETLSDTQTFGTLIDKWENTRPLPEIDEDLQDVDKIGLYLDVFFKGHLAKMMGLKNGLSNLYTKYMEKYTVMKPEYSGEEDNDALFDAIFGNQDNMSD